MKRRIKVLHPTSAWGGGHVQTCINLIKGMQRAGADTHLHIIRSNVDMSDVPYSPTVPTLLARLGLRKLERARRARTEQRFLSALDEGEIACLWPTVSIKTYREISRRGNPIVMEGINTRMASARRILDAVYENAGRAPAHKISDARIAEEEEMLSLATHFFAPNPGVDAALIAPDSAFRGLAMKTSYGAWMPSAAPPDRTKLQNEVVTVIAVGMICLRKNTHGLLRAWRQLNPSGAKLVLCGAVDPEITQLCEAELAMQSVEVRGHVSDMNAVYRTADVFVMPSFEEGGPQVTYEAAVHAVPVIASPMGAGRMQEHEGAVLGIDPYDVTDMAAKIEMLIKDAELRRHYGARAYELAPLFDWNAVGRERYSALQHAFSEL